MMSDLRARGSPTTTTCSRGTSVNDSNPLNLVISSGAIRMMVVSVACSQPWGLVYPSAAHERPH